MPFGHPSRPTPPDNAPAHETPTGSDPNRLGDEDRRQRRRKNVLDTAQILFGDSTIDCLVLDQSPEGMNIRTGTVVSVPERVTIEFRNTKVAATKRWARGLHMGFSFEA